MAQHTYATMIRSALKDLIRQVGTLPAAVALVKDAAGTWGIAWAGLLLVSGLLPMLVALLSKYVMDGIFIAAGKGGTINFTGVVLPALILAFVMILSVLCKTASDWVRTLLSERISDHVTGLIHDKSTSVDMVYYDLADFYDHLHRAKSEAAHRPLALMQNLGDFFRSTISFVSMIGLILPYGPWFPVLLIASTIPAFFAALFARFEFHEWFKNATQRERKARYLDWLATSREAAAEIRAFGTGERFRETFQTLRKKLRTERMNLLKNRQIAEISGALIALGVTCAVMLWMVFSAAAGQVTPGDLLLFYQAFSNGQKMAHAILENIGEIYGNSLFIDDLFAFLSLEPKITDPQVPSSVPEDMPPEIRFENVCFRYPGTDRYALYDCSMHVPAGKTIAIIGKNGAGKSTLIRLLYRFYDPERGRITINGTDIRKIPLRSLRRMLTVMFQAPVRYADTLANNIGISDIDTGMDDPKIRAAAQIAGADEIAGRMPDGFDTLLGRWFSGGHDLSEGEWRRIALARAMYRYRQIILLDEPTSAMDSWAEAKWIENFREYARGRTAIIVSHRFTTAMHAHIIFVLENGRIVESGSHESLKGLDGPYSASFLAQAGKQHD